jgi:hypothetical protein
VPSRESVTVAGQRRNYAGFPIPRAARCARRGPMLVFSCPMRSVAGRARRVKVTTGCTLRAMAEPEPFSSSRAAYRTIRELADDDRPRERLLKHGAAVLSDGELIAIVLGSGVPGENVVDMARALVDSLGGLSGLARADAKALQRTRGLGPAKAAQLTAAVELGRRVQQLDPDSRPQLTTPEAVFALLHPRLVGQSKE